MNVFLFLFFFIFIFILCFYLVFFFTSPAIVSVTRCDNVWGFFFRNSRSFHRLFAIRYCFFFYSSYIVFCFPWIHLFFLFVPFIRIENRKKNKQGFLRYFPIKLITISEFSTHDVVSCCCTIYSWYGRIVFTNFPYIEICGNNHSRWFFKHQTLVKSI